MDEGVDLEAAWSSVLQDWDDPARHAAFVTLCRISGRLGVAATRYRAVSAQDEAYRSLAARSEDAKKRLASITALALIDLQLTATPPDEGRQPIRWLKAIAVLFLVGACLMLHRACST